MSDQVMSSFARNTMLRKYSHDTAGGKEEWVDIARRVTDAVLDNLATIGACVSNMDKFAIFQAIWNREFIPGGRYLYASGRSLHQVNNCVLLRADDSREGWAKHMWKNGMALMTGAGVGTEYSLIRPEGSVIHRTGGLATGPIALMMATNEWGRQVQQGGSRRSALWAGLSWKHKDVFKFIDLKNWSPEVCAMKAKDFNAPAPMDGTNISVGLDDEFFWAYHDAQHPLHKHAHDAYWTAVEQMLRTGEPGFSVNCGENAGEDLRNACTELTSRDDSDICNIGSINMARVKDRAHMKELVRLGTLFLLAGSVYSDIPYKKIGKTRDKNRRLGLGLMGLHEWLVVRGKPYAADGDLADYLNEYWQSTEIARKLAEAWGISPPVKTRAIAPTGTIGILGESSTGCEPIFCVAFKRRYLIGNDWNYEYVVDPTAKRLIDSGTPEDKIQDAYKLAETPEARIAFQAWLQGYVDHGISSTLNLPAWGTEFNNADRVKDFGNMLMKYLPKLRGITTYPDGARSGQPLTPCSYAEATSKTGQVFVEAQDICSLTNRGSCGS